MRHPFLSNPLRFVLSVMVLSGMARAEVTPDLLEFRRQATQRMIFDRAQEIPLSGLHRSKIVGLDLMHPLLGTPSGDSKFEIHEGTLRFSAQQASRADRWIGGSVDSIHSHRMISR